MTAPADRPAVTPSSGNVFADLGLPDADLLLRVADLAIEAARLRGLLEALVEKVPVAYDHMDAEECAYCWGDMDGFARKWGRTPVPMHAPDCPWLLASAALATGGPRAANEEV